ncbi:hypothetical protein N9B90_00860 [bacterium]|nr:hypothetical protein [bacterium]
MKNYRNIAGAYHRALELGLVDGEEIVAWSDAVMEVEDDPDMAFIDASCSDGDHVVLLAALQEVPGDVDAGAQRRFVFGLMLAAVNRNAELAAPVAKVLHEMASDKDVPDADAEACMLRFHDDLGNGGDVHGPLTEFLNQHGEAI